MSEWISVKDSLPTEYGKYAVYAASKCSDCKDKQCDHTFRFRADCCLAFWSEPISEEGDYFLVPHWESLSLPECYITHWTELPDGTYE